MQIFSFKKVNNFLKNKMGVKMFDNLNHNSIQIVGFETCKDGGNSSTKEIQYNLWYLL